MTLNPAQFMTQDLLGLKSSPELEDKIEEKLGNSKTCPHGYPIPDKEGLIVQDNTVKLSELKANEKGVIISVFEENSEMLQYLGSLGLYPQVEVEKSGVI